MEKSKITIRNYRSIPYSNPISLDIQEGITFILGINNIGKSNLLRFFYELRGIVRKDGILPNHRNFGGDTFYSSIKNQNSNSNSLLIQLETSNQIYSIKIDPNIHLNHSSFLLTLESKEKIQGMTSKYDLEMLASIFNDSMYVGSFRTPMFQANEQYFDISIGQSFIKNWDSWANGNIVENRTKIRQLKNELKELFGFKNFDISVTSDKKNLIIETDNGSFYLDELGGGIGHFILVLGNALIRQPSFILIDEPENALHPKMQETFMRTLASKAKVGVIATSHSIALARSTADNIYSLNKSDEGKLCLTQYGDNYKPSVLNTICELGYSQFVELGGNNILLVEGKTDIKVFKEILRKYQIEQHFIIIDLGGSSFINGNSFDELNELKRLNAKSYSVIFDSEIEQDGQELKSNFKKFIDICKELKFNVFATECHSTDNYITQEAINKILGESYKALSKYESLEKRDKEMKWGKSLNWKMIREMSKSDFHETKLNEFIETILVPLTR